MTLNAKKFFFSKRTENYQRNLLRCRFQKPNKRGRKNMDERELNS